MDTEVKCQWGRVCRESPSFDTKSLFIPLLINLQKEFGIDTLGPLLGRITGLLVRYSPGPWSLPPLSGKSTCHRGLRREPGIRETTSLKSRPGEMVRSRGVV